MNQAVIQQQANQAVVMPIHDYETFYRFYLTEHSNVMSRRLHALGSVSGLYCIYRGIKTGQKSYFAKALVAGYTCAWVGHFFFERNKPASFKQPMYSFISDWRMLSDICRGRVSLRHAKYDKHPQQQ